MYAYILCNQILGRITIRVIIQSYRILRLQAHRPKSNNLIKDWVINKSVFNHEVLRYVIIKNIGLEIR